jgi:outer membrane lipase/esterase
MPSKILRIVGLTLIAGSLVACGGNDPTPPKTRTSAVYVMGDSLADVGTFGFKFTVQDASSAKGFPLWTQLVANVVGLDGAAQCNAYLGTSEDNIFDNPTAGCTNYAIGGGRIIVPGKPTNPRNIVRQLERQSANGNYKATDLVLINGGANDVADLVGAYLGATPVNPAGQVNFRNFLLQQLDTTTADSLLGQANVGGALAAGAYMQKLADTFYGQIEAQVLKKGEAKVVILNIPDITLTPRFQAVLAAVEAGQQGQATALQAALRQWISAFNSRLASKIGTNTRVALVDFYADFSDQVNSPARYQISNAQIPVCTAELAICTSAALDGTPGKTAGWWKSYTFADGFHPTPYGHQLLTATVARAMARAGWL